MCINDIEIYNHIQCCRQPRSNVWTVLFIISEKDIEKALASEGI